MVICVVNLRDDLHHSQQQLVGQFVFQIRLSSKPVMRLTVVLICVLTSVSFIQCTILVSLVLCCK